MKRPSSHISAQITPALLCLSGCFWLLLSWPGSVQGAIYQCVDEQGNTVFSDLGCPGRQVLTLPQIQVLEFTTPPGSAPRPGTGSGKRDRSHRPAPDVHWQRRQACEQARQVLQQIRRKRRQGYDLAEASSLDAQANAAKRDRQQYCH